MSVAARTTPRVQARRAVLARVGLGAAPALAALVAASFGLRAGLAWLRATPTFFPDEYIYAELARTLVEGGRPLVRDASADFPALLQPILTAPAWLVDDVETSFRIVQTLGALLMSLAAVPVFLLARRVGLGSRLALVLAALALVVPDVLYSGFVLAEPIAYPLALAAVLAGVAALARPGRRAQVGFLALAGLAAFARVQFAVLPLCFLAAVVAVGLRERRLRAALREQAIAVGVVALPAVALLAVGPSRALGFYEGVLDLDVASVAMARWVGVDAMMLVYASGVVLAPGAVLGLWLALRRPRSREELAFGALAAAIVVALVLEAAAYGLEGRVQERYFFYAVPLVGIAFALYASRGWPHRLAHGALAAGLVAVAARVPLSGYAAGDGKTSAPTLFAMARLEQLLGDVGLASLVLALGVTLLLAVVVATTRRPGTATPVALGLALAVSATVSAAAVSFTLTNAERIRRDTLGPQPSFVDRSGVEGSAMLQTRTSDRGTASEYLFWNRSVEAVYLLPGAQPPDAFAATRLTIAPDGTLLAGGKPVTRPLVADGFSDTLRFRDSEEVASAPVYRLVRSRGPQRLALYADGRYADGWLGLHGTIRVWPDTPADGLAGVVSFRLTAPEGSPRVAVSFELPGGVEEEVVVAPGAPRAVSFPACAEGVWRATFAAPSTGSAGGRFVSVRAGEPVYRPDARACPRS
ncbi:MAG TPA: hypothetical protein VFR63_09355 [Gaiellaceae bacterium]|nr:hypothetical protein [Gaiellaceae bacterium]